MSLDPRDNPETGRAIRRAPASGEVVSPHSRPARPVREIDDDPSEEDLAKLDSPVRTCPGCGKEVFDDTEVCYHCGHAFSAEPKGPGLVPVLIALALIAGIVLVFVF